METWGPRCDKIEFFIDRPPGVDSIPDLPSNVIEINMSRYMDRSFDKNPPWPEGENERGDRYRYGKHIWEKMWRSWIWVRDNRALDYEWFVKVDDDCFFFPENLRWFVKAREWSPIDAHYFGHRLYHRVKNEGVMIIAGATVVWSRATLEIAATAYDNMPKGGWGRERGLCEDRPLASEEMTTAQCMKAAGLVPQAAVDQQNREMVLLFHASALLLEMARPPHGSSAEGWCVNTSFLLCLLCAFRACCCPLKQHRTLLIAVR
jgi:hypothetical protein